MALQAAALLPSAFAIPKVVHCPPPFFWFLLLTISSELFELTLCKMCCWFQGKSSVSLKDSFLFGISLSDHVKVESSSSALRFKANIIY
ncbi:hypothetical protein ACSBR1_001451 [Camellia fascicularis]